MYKISELIDCSRHTFCCAYEIYTNKSRRLRDLFVNTQKTAVMAQLPRCLPLGRGSDPSDFLDLVEISFFSKFGEYCQQMKS